MIEDVLSTFFMLVLYLIPAGLALLAILNIGGERAQSGKVIR